MLLKFWAFVYRYTGYFSNYARAMEYQHIKSHWSEINIKIDKLNLTSKEAISLQAGVWQAKNGFYRRMKGNLK